MGVSVVVRGEAVSYIQQSNGQLRLVQNDKIIEDLCGAIAAGWRTNPLWSTIPVDCFCADGIGAPQIAPEFLSYLCDTLQFAAQTYQPARASEWLDEVGILTGQLGNIVGNALVVDMVPLKFIDGWYKG